MQFSSQLERVYLLQQVAPGLVAADVEGGENDQSPAANQYVNLRQHPGHKPERPDAPAPSLPADPGLASVDKHDSVTATHTSGHGAAFSPGRGDAGHEDEISRSTLRSAKPYSEKWIVITTVQLPTDAVRTMAAQPGWMVVAVGDKKTPAGWKLENCVFLSVERQAELGFNLHRLIPYRHYGRKNIGYLFAIQHGARVIYDTDDDNELIVDRLEEGFIIDFDKETDANNMLVYLPSRSSSAKHKPPLPVVNPYLHFGQKNLWPRGYPLSSIGMSTVDEFNYRRAGPEMKPYVQQGLANGDPDVDAVFRLTRKRAGVKVDLTFDREAPPVTIPPGLMSPFNTQNTVIHHQAFWGLLVPVTTTFRVCDIWRGYWMQRVLWDVGGTLSFHKASVYQERNEHNYFFDHVDEFQLHNDSRRLVEFLLSWQPSPEVDLFSRIRDLGRKMAEGRFWKEEDALLVDAWLSDLQAIGYKPPVIQRKNEDIFREVGSFPPASLPSTYLTNRFSGCEDCVTERIAAQGGDHP